MAEGVHTEESESENAKKSTRSSKGAGGNSRSRRRVQKKESTPPNDVELSPLPGAPTVLSRNEHCISRKNIDSECLKVMGRLIRYGHRSFLVGGGVRDLLLERTPKDFDVSTEASPEQVRKLFRNSRIIGRRFRLNHVFFKGGKTIEVSTFRREGSDDDEEVQTLAKDNTYGDPETDALRRDLTINGLFYDLSTFSVVDYVGGIDDLNNRIVRVIGEPDVRFTEDPVRMIRAVRHAARTGFTIEPKTYEAIGKNADLINLCPKARLFEEFQREISGGYSASSIALLEETGLLQHLFPELARTITGDTTLRQVLFDRLARMDAVVTEGASPPRLGLLFGALLFDMLDDSVFEKEPALREYWKRNPSFDELDAAPPIVAQKPTGRRKSSPLLQCIDSLFEEVGLPRKERERLEKALVTRVSLLEFDPDDSFGRRLKKSSSFQDALILMDLLDVDESQSEILTRWRATLKSNKPKGKSSGETPSRRRKSRRSSRGRRRGGAANKAANKKDSQ